MAYTKKQGPRTQKRDLRPNLGDAGLFGRHYPNLETRLKTIEKINSLPERTRSSNERWKLGEYFVLNADKPRPLLAAIGFEVEAVKKFSKNLALGAKFASQENGNKAGFFFRTSFQNL